MPAPPFPVPPALGNPTANYNQRVLGVVQNLEEAVELLAVDLVLSSPPVTPALALIEFPHSTADFTPLGFACYQRQAAVFCDSLDRIRNAEFLKLTLTLQDDSRPSIAGVYE